MRAAGMNDAPRYDQEAFFFWRGGVCGVEYMCPFANRVCRVEGW